MHIYDSFNEEQSKEIISKSIDYFLVQTFYQTHSKQHLKIPKSTNQSKTNPL